MGKNIVVIGAGLSGLSAAALLAKKGDSVTVLEKNGEIGGRIGIWRQKGFVFDIGPSWYLMPEVFEDFFSKFGKTSSDYFKLTKLDPSYRAYFAKDDYYDIPSDKEKTAKLFETFEKGSGPKFLRYLSASESLYKMAMKNYMYVNNYHLRNLVSLSTIKNMLGFPFWQSMETFVGNRFSSSKIKKILQYNLVFLGGAPKNTPALYSLMAHVDFNLGVFYPKSGMYELARAIASVASEQGAKIKLSHEVLGVVTEKGKIKSLITDKGEIKADVVLNTSDYWHFETKVLEKKDRSYSSQYWKKRKVAPSAFVMCLGVSKKLLNIRHHSLFFANNWDEHFDTIFGSPKLPSEPSFYVCAPSVTDTTVAPKGYENLFFLVPFAPGLKLTEKTKEQFANKMIELFEKYTGESVKKNVVVKKIFAVDDYRREYNAFKGTAFGLSHTLFQTSFLRPNIKSKKLSNLYYAGQYVHPGIGLPSVIISAEIAANEIHAKH